MCKLSRHSFFFLIAGLLFAAGCDSGNQENASTAYEIRSVVEGDTSQVSFTTVDPRSGREYANAIMETFQATSEAMGMVNAKFSLHRGGTQLGVVKARPNSSVERGSEEQLSQEMSEAPFSALQRQVAEKMVSNAEKAGVEIVSSQISISVQPTRKRVGANRAGVQNVQLAYWSVQFECNVPLASEPYCTAEIYNDGAKVDEYEVNGYGCAGTVCATGAG
jgi:hypothetical protein